MKTYPYDIENIWQDLRTAYNGNFKNLVYGELPNGKSVAAAFKENKRIVGTLNSATVSGRL